MKYYPEIVSLIKNNQELIDENRFEELYWKINHLNVTNVASNLTKLLMNDDINFLKYIDYVPIDCFKDLDIKDFNIPDNVKRIERSAFALSKIESITIPESVTFIGRAAFYGCHLLKKITIPGSVNSIDESVFEDCTSLENVQLNEGIKTIGAFTFDNTAIKSIVFPNSIEAINRRIFSNCKNLESVTFGRNLQFIGEKIFLDYGNQITINYNSTISMWNKVKIAAQNRVLLKSTIHCIDGDCIGGGTKV